MISGPSEKHSDSGPPSVEITITFQMEESPLVEILFRSPLPCQALGTVQNGSPPLRRPCFFTPLQCALHLVLIQLTAVLKP